jgi:hypothetical protein
MVCKVTIHRLPRHAALCRSTPAKVCRSKVPCCERVSNPTSILGRRSADVSYSFLWGFILFMHVVCDNFAKLAVVRFFLGMAEAM